MTQDFDALGVFNTIALGAFLVLVLLAGGRMAWRLGLFLLTGTKVPVLLKRDIFLYGTFALYFGFALAFRLAGIVVSKNPFWVIPSTVIALAAMGYWVWVEYHLDQ